MTPRLLRDIDTLLAEVERLRAEYELAGEQIDELETEAEASAAEMGKLREGTCKENFLREERKFWFAAGCFVGFISGMLVAMAIVMAAGS